MPEVPVEPNSPAYMDNPETMSMGARAVLPSMFGVTI